jgi:hypothetical protein
MTIEQTNERTRAKWADRYARLAFPILLSLLSGCVYSPLPDGAVARLYHWPDRGTAIAERQLVPIGNEHIGYLFADILFEAPQLKDLPDRSYLLESCLDAICYSAVVFPGQFRLTNEGEVAGAVHLTSISTAIAADTAELGSDQVAHRIDTLTRLILGEDEEVTDYTHLLRLDLHGNPEHAQLLAHPALLEKADEKIALGETPRLSRLLQDAGIQTSELVASETFLFSNSWDFTIDLDVSGRQSGRLYLTLCGDYEQDGDGFAVDYSNCQLKTAVDDGKYTALLRLTGLTDRLLVTIVPMNNPQQVEYVEWRRDRDGDRLTVR